jgi:hypothetical protein
MIGTLCYFNWEFPGSAGEAVVDWLFREPIQNLLDVSRQAQITKFRMDELVSPTFLPEQALRQNQRYQGVSKIAGCAVFLRKTALGSSGFPYCNSDFALVRHSGQRICSPQSLWWRRVGSYGRDSPLTLL